jgi:hypothetical protein
MHCCICGRFKLEHSSFKAGENLRSLYVLHGMHGHMAMWSRQSNSAQNCGLYTKDWDSGGGWYVRWQSSDWGFAQFKISNIFAY